MKEDWEEEGGRRRKEGEGGLGGLGGRTRIRRRKEGGGGLRGGRREEKN